MIGTSKWLAIVAVAFIAGAFIASPDLRANAANTVFSTDIVDGEVKTADLASNAVTAAKVKDGEIKAAEIATDAVGAAEIAGVTKLLFGQCKATTSEATVDVINGFTLAIDCTISGVDSDDSAFADKNSGNHCFLVETADAQTGRVRLSVTNYCGFTSQLGQAEFSVMVYDK
jgi:hypothetical protein